MVNPGYNRSNALLNYVTNNLYGRGQLNLKCHIFVSNLVVVNHDWATDSKTLNYDSIY